MPLKKADLLALGLLFLTLVLWFGDLFSLQSAFLCGDHREQQYPWAYFLQSQIRQFHLPWWTQSIHAGFPLLAEGQIGALYPINWIFFFSFPIKIAYNYSILFHYVLGAFLFYCYLRRIRLSVYAAIFSVLIYLYGSAQGGYFYYNFISQKVVIWLPLALILIDRLIEHAKFRDALWLSFIFTLEILAGYLQVAVYTLLFSILYFAFFWMRKRSLKVLAYFSISGVLAVFFSLIQLLPTYELAQFSSRAQAVRDLAFIGSMNPAGFFTLFYPSWDGFLGSELYIGIFGLFFVFLSVRYPRNAYRNFFLLASAVFLLLSLGKWGILYPAIVDLTHFYSFRTPIKFLFFAAFSLSVLAGFGFDFFFKILENPRTPLIRFKKLWTFWILGVFFLALPAVSSLVLHKQERVLLQKLTSYVEENIYGKPGHPHGLDYYRDKSDSFYKGLKETVSLSTLSTRREWILLLASLSFLFWLSTQSRISPVLKMVVLAGLIADLYLYSFTSIQANKEPFDSIPPPLPTSALSKVLESDKSQFRIIENVSFDSQNLRYPILPSSNLLWKIDDLGAYSPLIMKAYRDELAGWAGHFNDSFQTSWMNPAKFLSRLEDLTLLNVKYILSHQRLEDPRLEPKAQEDEFRLYQIKAEPIPRAFFVPSLTLPENLSDVPRDKIEPVTLKTYDHGRMVFEINNSKEGFLLVSETAYPGWRALDQGTEIPIQKWGKLFQAIPLAPGDHQVTLNYHPVLYRNLGWSGFALALLLILAAFIFKRPKLKHV